MDNFFFILSKFAWALLSPGNLLLILFMLGSLFFLLNLYKAAKLILIPTLILSAMILCYPMGDYLISPLEQRFSAPKKLPEKIDGILILGGGEDLKRSLSSGRAELGLGGDRYIGVKELANHYPNAPVIFTGGSGLISIQGQNKEANLANRLLTTLGIPATQIILESDSRNTYENFKNVKPLLPDPKGDYVLVTSAYHMPRSVGIARKVGIHVIPYPVDYRANSDELRRFDIDFFDHLKSLESAWREWIGLTVYALTDKTNEWIPAPEKK